MNESILLELRKAFGNSFKKKRLDNNLSKYALGKLSGLSIEQINHIELGDKAYTIDSFLKISYALDNYLK